MLLDDLFPSGQICETDLTLGTGADRAPEWIKKVYDQYPATWQRNHVMTWGEGKDQELAMFELVPNPARPNHVEVKWFQAYPLRRGVGTRAMQELQRLAREAGIGLTLYAWDKGQVSRGQLMKFYRRMGFRPTAAKSANMVWNPDQVDEVRREKIVQDVVREVADQPYRWTQIRRSPMMDKYAWQASDGAQYNAQIAKTYQGQRDPKIIPPGAALKEIFVGFMRTDPKTGRSSIGITGTGDAFRVFATIRDIVLSYVNSQDPPEYVSFGGKAAEPSRIALYRRIAESAQRWLPGYSLVEQDRDEGEVYFRLQRRGAERQPR